LNEFKDILSGLLDDRGLVLSLEDLDSCINIYGLACKWGQKINITANLKPSEFAVENILDPILAFHSVESEKGFTDKRLLVDLGCGGGFVGFCWYIIGKSRFKGLKLVDGDRRKINFCRQVARELGLKQVECVHSRTEDLIENDSVYLVTRATWPPKEAVKASQGLLKHPDTRFFHLQGPDQGENLQASWLNKWGYTLPPAQKKRYVLESR